MKEAPDMIAFGLGTFSVAGCLPFAGLVRGRDVVALDGLAAAAPALGHTLGDTSTVLGFLQEWDRNLDTLQRLLGDESFGQNIEACPLERLRIHAPVERPRQILCTGANYRKHVIDLLVAQGAGASTQGMNEEQRRRWAEAFMDDRAASGDPYVFAKLPTTVCGPHDPVEIPADTQEADWELELAVVIGRGGRHIDRVNAMDHVAGYMIVNDLTARDFVYRHDLKALGTDWLRAKSRPGFLPCGPFLVPRASVVNPMSLNLRLRVNGKVMQDETTADMVFDISRQIEYISKYVTLLPGDVICTGSPAGNGAHHGKYLSPGDVMEASITGLGTQRTPCIAEQRN